MIFFQPIPSHISLSVLFVYFILLFFWYLLVISFYRLYLHPLRHYPGPKIAALTTLYEFYHDAVIARGGYLFRIVQMHETYGPIVRVSPDELHINDPAMVEELYTSGGRIRNKYSWHTRSFGLDQSAFGTVPHDHHRLRRAAMNPFFSKQSITKLEPVIHKKVDLLCKRLCTYGSSARLSTTNCRAQKPVACNLTMSYGLLNCPAFQPNLQSALLYASELSIYGKHFPMIYELINWIPDSWIIRLIPTMKPMIDWRRQTKTQVRDIIAHEPSNLHGSSQSNSVGEKSRTIFHDILRSNLPNHEKTVERLCQESQVLIGAGTETTSRALAVTTYYILNNPSVHSRLESELQEAIPDSRTIPMWKAIEELPYLTACIREGLRLSHGIASRLPRIAPYEELKLKVSASSPSRNFPAVYANIPRGTPVSMSAVLIHLNPEVFYDPHKYIPERWLEDGSVGERNRQLHHYLLAFSRGSRSCLGINLAYAELYITLATIFRRFSLQLWQTEESAVKLAHDFFLATAAVESEGVRVNITVKKI